MSEQSKIEERRQRIFEALWGSAGELPDETTAEDLVKAIDVATRVKITDEARRAYLDAWGARGCSVAAGLAAALAELGFEVES